MEVKDIVKQYLIDHGYDGLYSDDNECACEIDGLAPCYCSDGSFYCQPGIKKPCDPETCPADGDCEWHMHSGEPHPPTPSPIARDAAEKYFKNFPEDYGITGEDINDLVPFIQAAIDADRRERGKKYEIENEQTPRERMSELRRYYRPKRGIRRK